MLINGIGEQKQLEVTHTKVGSVLLIIHEYGKARPTHITVDEVWFKQALEGEVRDREKREAGFAKGITQVPKQRDTETSEETGPENT